MKKYKVNVNGTNYEIGIELMSETEASAAKTQAAPANAEAPAAATPVSGDGQQITCPMPGTILDVKVTEGQSVKSGDVLMILEAMKMENEIMAPCDGQVTAVVAKGTSAQTGMVLCTIK